MEPSQPEMFHAGEQAIQERLGVRARLTQIGRVVIRDHMPDQHREFFTQLPFVVVGALDARGQPWASLLAGPPGFITSPDPHRLVIGASSPDVDPLHGRLAAGAPIGLLGIEPHTRRRNRVNGVVEKSTDHAIELRVSQSFGNCPKYIQARKPEWVDRGTASSAAVQRSDQLDAGAQRLIRDADTFFIASAHPLAADGDGPTQGVDVSHRGGKPGFVRVDDERRLTVPDFIGNFFFNTLGNLVLNPCAGLLFQDFDSGARLHIAVTASIVWDGPEVQAYVGAQRLLRFEIREVRRVANAAALRWGSAERSPFLDATGSWS